MSIDRLPCANCGRLLAIPLWEYRRLERDWFCNKACLVEYGRTTKQDLVAVAPVDEIKVPDRFLGRRSRITGERSMRMKLLAAESGLSIATVNSIFMGKQRPYQKTVDKLAPLGVSIPFVYTQRLREMPAVKHRCQVCHRKYTSPNRVSRFCSRACTMRAWHENQRTKRLCNWCGKPADGKYSFTCKLHDTDMRRLALKERKRRHIRFLEEGLCDTCGRLPAREGRVSCVLCFATDRARRTALAISVKEERRQRGAIGITEATKVLGYAHISSTHKLIASGKLAIMERSGRNNKRFYVRQEDVERYSNWRSLQQAHTVPAAPFVSVPDPQGLLNDIKQLLPGGIPEDVADDAVGAIMLDLLENKLDATQLTPILLSAYVKEAYQWRGDPYRHISLETPLNEDGDVIGDLLGEEDSEYDEVLERLL